MLFVLGTPSMNRLDRLLTNKRVLKDVEKLSPHYQTSALESFHSVILRFAPKNVVFPFIGMLCRYVIIPNMVCFCFVHFNTYFNQVVANKHSFLETQCGQNI